MAVLEILTAPDPRLKLTAKTVVDVGSVQSLINDMLETLYATSNGIGLAATQLGRTEAVVVIDISEERNNPVILINPKIVSGEAKVIGQEGCLSVPDYYADVERLSSVTVSGLDRNGNEVIIDNDGFWLLSCSMKLIICMAIYLLITYPL